MKKIKIYTLPTCSECMALKTFLEEHNINFEEIDVSQNIKERDRMIEKTKQEKLPIIETDDQIIINFGKEKICKLLNIKE